MTVVNPLLFPVYQILVCQKNVTDKKIANPSAFEKLWACAKILEQLVLFSLAAVVNLVDKATKTVCSFFRIVFSDHAYINADDDKLLKAKFNGSIGRIGYVFFSALELVSVPFILACFFIQAFYCLLFTANAEKVEDDFNNLDRKINIGLMYKNEEVNDHVLFVPFSDTRLKKEPPEYSNANTDKFNRFESLIFKELTW